MKKKVIRMGVIGVGGIARGAHIPNIQRSPDAVLTALCDIDPEKLESAAKAYHIDAAHCFLNYEDLLKCPDVDAVSICTPNDVHVPIALKAVQHRKPFAVEKPLSIDVKSAKKLSEAVKASGIPSMICFSYRFRGAACYAKELIAQGKLGKLRHVYTRYVQSWGNPSRNCPRVWRFHAAITGTGALGDLGSHMLDLVRFMTGEEYVNFVAQNGTFVKERRSPDPAKKGVMEPVDVDDYSHYFALTEGGIATSFEISRLCFGRGNCQRIEIYGDKGALVYELEREDSLSVCFEKDQESNCRFDRVAIPEKYWNNQMQTFFNIVNGKKRHPGATIEDGYLNQVHLEAVQKASDTKRSVSVKVTKS